MKSRHVTICAAALLAMSLTACKARRQPAASTQVTDVGVSLDPSRIVFRQNRMNAPVTVAVTNPDYSVTIPTTVLGNNRIVMPSKRYLYGNGLFRSAPQAWGLYLDVQPDGSPGLPRIEMDVANASGTYTMTVQGGGGRGWGVWGGVGGPQRTTYTASHSLTVNCRFFDGNGTLVHSIQSTKTHNSGGEQVAGVATPADTAPGDLANQTFEEILHQFFANPQVMAVLEGGTGPPGDIEQPPEPRDPVEQPPPPPIEAIRYCDGCGAQWSPDSNFCRRCGAKDD